MKIRPALHLLVCILFALAATEKVFAQLSAHFETRQIDYNAEVGDCDFVVLGTPTCELYFQMGIFSTSGLQGDLAHHPGGCSTQSFEDGIWNFTDQEISASLPNLASHATVYFGLFDEDPDLTDEDDLLGTFTSAFTNGQSRVSANNNMIPSAYTVTACDDSAIDDDRKSNRFDLAYSVWFTDASAPAAPGTAQHNDPDSPTGWDNDTRLDFSWLPASDPHSGIEKYEVAVEKGGVPVATWTVSGSAASISVCSGCAINYSIVNGSSYRIRQRALNGASIGLSSPAWSDWSPWSATVVIDTDYPATTIDSPESSAWQNSDFNVGITDSDTFLDYCQYRINGGEWMTRTCNTSRAVTVGNASGKNCQQEGSHTLNFCFIEARSIDNGGNISLEASRAFSIDFTAEAVTNISAATEPGGEIIVEGSWTIDRDPFFYWSTEGSHSPINGYSYAVNSGPDCLTLETPVSSSALPSGSLGDGEHVFNVRAIDAAGNCGLVSPFSIRVDGSAETISSLLAYTEPGGSEIAPGVPQPDNSPYLEWESSASVSPIAGYSYNTEGEPDCTIETTDRFANLSQLNDGTTTFAVRAIDSAGNCGNVASFDILVERPVKIFSDGFELPEPP